MKDLANENFGDGNWKANMNEQKNLGHLAH